MAENIYMPETAQYMQWVDYENSCDLYYVIWFPSKTVPDLLFEVHIDRDDRQMSCNCPSFSGGTDKNGNPYPGKGFCSHVKKLRWVCQKHGHYTKAISLAARLAQSEEWLDEKKVAILNEVSKMPHTCDELEVILALKHQTCSALINWLYKNGWLEDSGDLRPTRSGAQYKAIVWQIP